MNPTHAKGLYARINKGNGKSIWQRIEIHRRNPVPVEGASYYFLRYVDNGKRIIKPLGTDLNEAFIAWQNHDEDVTRQKNGKTPIHRDPLDLAPGARSSSPAKRVRIADAVREYLAELPTLDKSPATILAYTNALNGFVESCTKTFTDEIDRADIIRYMAWMRSNIQKRKHGEKNRTIRNRLTYLGTFLGQKCGVPLKKPKGATANAPGLLFANDLPKTTKRPPDKYSLKTINALLAAADENERFLIEFFLYTGCRDEEVAHMEWSDFDEDSMSVRVQPKPHLNWKVKDHEIRDLDVLPSHFVKKMIRFRDSRPDQKCNLIFPSRNCRPCRHLVKTIQKVAVRAGLEGRFTLHKVRRTFGTIIEKQFGIATAQRLLGHADLQTTARYLAAEETDTAEGRASVDEAFSGVVGN
jgi:integrase